MGKHKGKKIRGDWVAAVTSAAEQVVADRAPPGNYTLETEAEEVKPPQKDTANRPIRDYTVTLDGPR
jgi:hypothetical protein